MRQIWSKTLLLPWFYWIRRHSFFDTRTFSAWTPSHDSLGIMTFRHKERSRIRDAWDTGSFQCPLVTTRGPKPTTTCHLCRHVRITGWLWALMRSVGATKWQIAGPHSQSIWPGSSGGSRELLLLIKMSPKMQMPPEDHAKKKLQDCTQTENLTVCCHLVVSSTSVYNLLLLKHFQKNTHLFVLEKNPFLRPICRLYTWDSTTVLQAPWKKWGVTLFTIIWQWF